jgi:hypothetical protein
MERILEYTMSDSRKIFEVRGAKIVVESKLANRVPLACPVCKILLRDRDDVVSHGSYGCCRLCELEIAYPNKGKWLQGWRPLVDDLEAIRKKRKQVPSYLMRTESC